MNPFKQFWEWLQPPGPVELGRSERDALPMRDFSDEDSYTWDDWEEEVRMKHPIRWFITHTFVRSVIWPIQRRVKDAWYWLQCHTLPSYRFHLLDLRNPGPGIPYSHGWQDRSSQVLHACFVLLRKFVEEEKPRDPAEWATPEELAEPGIASQKAEHDEIMALYDWWMRGRLEEEREEDRLYQETKRWRRRTPEHRVAMDAWVDYRRWREDVRENEMLHRLINVRQRLWT